MRAFAGDALNPMLVADVSLLLTAISECVTEAPLLQPVQKNWELYMKFRF
jgi:hypothetical protein